MGSCVISWTSHPATGWLPNTAFSLRYRFFVYPLWLAWSAWRALTPNRNKKSREIGRLVNKGGHQGRIFRMFCQPYVTAAIGGLITYNPSGGLLTLCTPFPLLFNFRLLFSKFLGLLTAARFWENLPWKRW